MATPRRRTPLGDLSNLIRPREVATSTIEDRKRMDKGKRKAIEPQPIPPALALTPRPSPSEGESYDDDRAPRPDSYARGPATPPRASPVSVASRPPFLESEPIPSTSSTPPQLSRPAFVELVETCPTPPSAATTESSRYRRRPLLHVPTFVSKRNEDDRSSLEPPRPPRHSSQTLLVSDDAPTAAEPEQDDRPLDLPSAWQNDTLSRRRSRQSRQSTDSARTASPLSELAAAELVASILLQGPQVAAASTADAPSYRRRPSLDTRRSSRLSNDPSSTSPYHEALRTSPSLGSRHRVSSSSHSLRPSATPSHSRAAPTPLRTRPSTVTLVSWDLSHLPAPNTPRERPFRLPLRSIFLPTSYLGGGKGTGLYGDPCGPIERKVKQERTKPFEAEADGTKVGLGERWCRWSGRRLSATGNRSRTSWDNAPSVASSTGEEADSLAHVAKRPPSRRSSLLRQLGRRSGLSPSTASSQEEKGTIEQPTSRRRSLVSAVFGSRRSKGASTTSSEDLGAWVSVVVR